MSNLSSAISAGVARVDFLVRFWNRIEKIRIADRVAGRITRREITNISLVEFLIYTARDIYLMPAWLKREGVGLVQEGGLDAEAHLEIQNTLITRYEEINLALTEGKFSPASRISDLAMLIIEDPVLTVSTVEARLSTSTDTAQRWLDKATRLQVLRRMKVGNTFYYIQYSIVGLIINNSDALHKAARTDVWTTPPKIEIAPDPTRHQYGKKPYLRSVQTPF